MSRICLCLTWLLLGANVCSMISLNRPQVTCEDFKNVFNGQFLCSKSDKPVLSEDHFLIFEVEDTKEKNVEPKTPYAIKVFYDPNDKNACPNPLASIFNLKSTKYLFIAKILANQVDNQNRGFILMKWGNKGILKDLILSDDPNLESLVSKADMFAKIAKGVLESQNELNRVHGDIKLTNIVVTGNSYAPQLINFDYSQEIKKQLCQVGTIGYMAPELLDLQKNMEWSQAQNVYSLGVLFYTMLHRGRKPFRGDNTNDVLAAMKRKTFKVGAYLTKKVGELLANCLRFDPEKRIKMEQLIAAAEDIVKDENPDYFEESTWTNTSIEPAEKLKKADISKKPVRKVIGFSSEDQKAQDEENLVIKGICSIGEGDLGNTKGSGGIKQINGQEFKVQSSKKNSRVLASGVVSQKSDSPSTETSFPHSSLTQALGLLLVGLLVLTAVLGAACRVRRSKPEFLGTVPSISTELPAH